MPTPTSGVAVTDDTLVAMTQAGKIGGMPLLTRDTPNAALGSKSTGVGHEVADARRNRNVYKLSGERRCAY